ncbi:hypothetical protein [Cellulosimicrobium sp. Marseille-Q8652]
MTSPDAVLRMIDDRAQPLPRIGVVTAVESSGLTVTFDDGTVTPRLQHDAGYAAVVGDLVKVSPTTSAWIVDGKVTAPVDVAQDSQVRVAPVHNWSKINPANFTAAYGPWWYQWDSPTLEGKRTVMAGQHPVQEGGVGHVQVRMENRANVLYFGSLTSHVPSGSTITGVSIVLYRILHDGGPALVPPVMYGHDHTPSNPPVGNMDGTTPGGGQPPHWVPGFGPLAFPAFGRGETTRLYLTSSWVTAWLAETITGVGFYSDRADQAFTSWGTTDNVDLLIDYIPPA